MQSRQFQLICYSIHQHQRHHGGRRQRVAGDHSNPIPSAFSQYANEGAKLNWSQPIGRDLSLISSRKRKICVRKTIRWRPIKWRKNSCMSWTWPHTHTYICYHSDKPLRHFSLSKTSLATSTNRKKMHTIRRVMNGHTHTHVQTGRNEWKWT